MRFNKNILWAAAAVFAAASCTILPEDTFSTNQVEPVMDSHTDILITNETKSEDVTFSWSKARFVDADEYLYNLYVSADDKDALLAKDIKETYYTLPKETFRTFLLDNFDFIQNATHDISVYVTVSDRNGEEYPSAPLDLKVYYYEAAVPAVVIAATEEVVLDKSTPSEEVELLSWSDARLVYGEDQTYKVTISVGEGAESVLASGLFDTSYSITVDALNEAVIAAGGAEDAASDVVFRVYACCESIPDGVVSNEVTIKVTTYIATFPDKMWLPGSHQGWNPATAPALSQSKKTKGMYQGFVDLTTADASDAQFKFCIGPEWGEASKGENFGFIDVTVETKVVSFEPDSDGNKKDDIEFAVVNSSTYATEGNVNIVVPSGFYYIKLDKKFGTLFMIQVKNLELIGSFSGWSGIAMDWNAAAGTWTAPGTYSLTGDDKFKVRFNSDWTYSFGGEMGNVVLGGGDIPFTKGESTFKMIFNVGTSDFYVNALDLNMPEYLVLPGNYSDHTWKEYDDFRVYLKDSDAGIYKGVVTMYNCTQGFKIAKAGQWIGLNGNVADGYTMDTSYGNGFIDDGTYAWEINLSTMTATATPVTKVGMIGDFNGWGGDVEMTFDPETLQYVGEVTLTAGDGWKFRFNGDWAYNYGLNAEGILVQDGSNIKAEESGTFEVVLDMAHGSYATYTMNKK